MINIPAPAHAREEWPDADFELPDGHPIRAPPDAFLDKDDDDWDAEMDLGDTGGAKLSFSTSLVSGASRLPAKGLVTIRPPPFATFNSLTIDGDDDDEGISTIKVSALPVPLPQKRPSSPRVIIDEDMEADFALPSDLTQLSLRPLSLHHRSSKGSMEWGDRDITSSSASSSEAYSSLGFDAVPSPSTISSVPTTDDDRDDDDDGDLDGLVIPTGLFESAQGRKKLTRILDAKKKTGKVAENVQPPTTNPEDDFEIGLVINGDDDLSPSKLIQNQQTKRLGTLNTRSNSAPARPSVLRPPSRLRGDRPRTPLGPSGPSRQSTSKTSTSPPNRPTQPKRSHTFLTLAPPSAPAPTSFLAPKPGGPLRNQKSHSGLKSPSPPNSAHRKLNRKASLSSLMESSNAQASGSSSSRPPPPGGYSATTASSRARTHTNSTSKMHSMDSEVPPTRPSTPATNPAALRLTMPTSMARMRSRPALTSVFPGASPPPSSSQAARVPARSPPPTNIPRPPSSLGSTKVLRRTKRRMFGDGSELDGIEDLPVDREKEARLRVQPKGYQNRIPSGSQSKADRDVGSRGTIRRKKEVPDTAMQPSTTVNTLKQKQSRLDNLSRSEAFKKRPSSAQSSGHTRRKPTLIRNLGGFNQPKVIGDMRWNPQTLRWEGNENVLREFDSAVATSVRPALITHLTGSSIGSPAGGTFGNAARVVGNMVFDPSKMCWMSTLPPEDDEPDVFADMADDEEDGDAWETKGGTIRASLQISRTNTSGLSDASSRVSDGVRMETPSPIHSLYHHSRSESGSDHGSRASIVFDVDDGFVDACRVAESRHRMEMKGWTIGRPASTSSHFSSEINRSHLYDIRTLATKQY